MEYVGELADVQERNVQAWQSSRQAGAALAAAQGQSVQLSVIPEAALALHSLFVGLIHGWVLDARRFWSRSVGCRWMLLAGLGFALNL
jgi:TetR/AcrR family acrAB operon transcriptional repressor